VSLVACRGAGSRVNSASSQQPADDNDQLDVLDKVSGFVCLYDAAVHEGQRCNKRFYVFTRDSRNCYSASWPSSVRPSHGWIRQKRRKL